MPAEHISKKPRVLVVTPEVTYLPEGMGNAANTLTAKAGGLADVSAALINALFTHGGDVHVAMPDYRTMFDGNAEPVLKKEFNAIKNRMPDDRVHLARDRAFFYMNCVYSSYSWENVKIALAFQREVINNIVPEVKPDLIHCNDWMTGLIPAMARELDIPCLFTIHNIFTVKRSLAEIEDRGVDAASFWKQLYFEWPPYNYEESRENNMVDFLVSGIFAAHFVNTVSPTFLSEIIDGRHGFVEPAVQQQLANKWHAGCAAGILNSPDPTFNPSTDPGLAVQYDAKNHTRGKIENKRHLQKKLGLVEDTNAPLFFWPSRLDRLQKGSQLLAHILYQVVSKYWDMPMQVVFVANGEYQDYFKQIVWQFHLSKRVAVCDFDEDLARLAYGASDFILMPSAFEPCGLPQMIGAIYGALPVAHDTGGIHDTIEHLNVRQNTGNGFLFKTHDPGGLLWAIDQAMGFYNLPRKEKKKQISRIMTEAMAAFNHSVTAQHYIDLYERMLKRPFLNP
ncbi:MAG: glycogen/starch synthase [Thermodesulfobacteriota bacterium]|nr:glycogen/starch synthase [Thermodesulfobacteriota bacterium]